MDSDSTVSDIIEQNTQELRAEYLTAEQTNLAASLLYRAYHDDALLQKILHFKPGKEAKYEEKLRALMREELVSLWQSEQPIIGVYVGDKLAAVGCLIHATGPLKAERYWHWRLKSMLTAGYITTNQLIKKEKVLREAMSPLGAYSYLSLFAVDPHNQKVGLARYLLRAIDDVCRQSQSSGCAVFVTQNQLTPLFESEGYQVKSQISFEHIPGALLFKSVD